uniref:DUF4220 domain-containing protein n=1 Tax=Populus alba TaxID=43335 RepID=A0A4U5P418_POPAL|nr:hypothetical protein D5086_0000227040 [Populus alba]
MLKNLPEEVINLWNEGEIRGMVLLSLSLQTILIIFGSKRKTIARSWIRILVWSAYLSADMVATVALGNLARSQGDSSDTITAYSIEDNELWLRHLLGLVVQVGVAFYVFSRSWGSGILTFIAIPMFIVGIIKYAERTWDLVPGIPALIKSQVLISKNTAENAFKVVEIELGLIYDMLYTKAPLIYSRAGIILRSISFLLTFTALISFQILIDKHAYSTIDTTITYLLFAAAVFLEFYAFICLVFSDWTMIWLSDEGGNALSSALYSPIRKLTKSKRWSRSIAQYNLISSSIENTPLGCLKSLGINEKMRQIFVHRVDMSVDLQHFIFRHLQKKAEDMKEDFCLIDKNRRGKITDQRGDGVLERKGLLQNYMWCTTEVEFSRSILVWHLATEICYLSDKAASNVPNEEYETSRCLSEYMMYLLVMRPNMLSMGIGDEGYLDTLQDLQRLIPNKTRGDQAKKGVVDGILRSELSLDDITFQSLWKIAKSVVIGGEKLARQLQSSESKKRWEIINEVWIEMLAYAAAHCPWKEHTHQLRRGGELLTHVFLLMLHLGLSEQYEFTRFDGDEVSVLEFFSSDESRKYQLAVEKYAKGIVDMSMSKPVEALYRYLAKTADTSLSGPDEVRYRFPSSRSFLLT